MLSPRPAVGVLVKVFPKLSETFILEELLGLERLGQRLVVYTLGPPTDAVAHPAVQRVQATVTQVPQRPWPSLPAALGAHAQALLAHPLRYSGALGHALQPLRRAWRQARPGEPGGPGSLIRRLRATGAALAAAWQGWQRALWLAHRLQRDGVAHLHTHFISSPADLALPAARLAGLPFSLSAHAKDIYLGEPADLRRKMAAARFTVTCTEFNCRTLRAIAPEAAVHRMYHGIDAAQFHPRLRLQPSLVPMLLSVGRLRAKKGLDTLIEACALLQQRGHTFRCEIVGYGDEQPRLEARIARLGLEGQVSLAGKLTREHVIARYARAAVYVQPSRITADGDRDGIPNVLLEAMAMALPVVATRVSGIPELVEHEANGLLVEADAPQALADAIARVLHDPALAARLGHAAREAVTRHFDNDHNLQLVLQLLHATEDHACAHPRTTPA